MRSTWRWVVVAVAAAAAGCGSDGGGGGGADGGSDAPVNAAPTISSAAPTQATEDVAVMYLATAVDVDGPALAWSLAPGHTCGGAIVGANGLLAFTVAGPVPPATCQLAIRVCDGAAPEGCAVQTQAVAIVAVNDPPVITSAAPLVAQERTPYVYAATVDDADGPQVRWSLRGDHTCGGAIDATGRLTFTRPAPTPATCTLAIQACDRGAPEACASQIATIAIEEINDPPTIFTSPPPGTTETTPYTYQAEAIDPDGPGLTWSLLPTHTCGGAIDPVTGRLAFMITTPIPPPTCTLAIQACDGGVPDRCGTQTVAIAITPYNGPLTVTTIPPDLATEDQPYVYTPAWTDDDGPAVRWAFRVGHTCGGTLDPLTGVFTFTPTGPVPPTACSVGLYACDNGAPNRCVVQTRQVGIIPVDDPPIAVDDGVHLMMQDGPWLTMDVITNDLDPDGGTYGPLAAIATQPAHGIAFLSLDGYEVMYLPEAGYCNSQPGGVPDAFTYALAGGSTAMVAVRVMCPAPPVAVAAGAEHTCARFASGIVRCWGDNSGGQLGVGDTLDRGDQTNEMGANLVPAWLGTGRSVQQVWSGGFHDCALLDDGSVKCWGYNTAGQLGVGHRGDRGTARFAIGDVIERVALGAGRSAVTLALGRFHTCAILDDGSVKCWGDGYWGQLGYGNTSARGDTAGEMGDALPVVPLGAGRTAVAIAAGPRDTCAILDDGSVKCWGDNSYGQLGQGDQVDRGDDPGELGDALPPIALGTGRTAIAIGVAETRACALLDDGSVKCWGDNGLGVLGIGDTFDRGRIPGQMGDALPAVALGTGRTAVGLAVGESHACALLDDGHVKCWGYNGLGELGVGDTTNRGADNAAMGDALPAVALGTGRTVVAVTSAGRHTCALLDDAAIKCWGYNSSGQLGLEHSETRGTSPGGMGDNLPAARF